MKVQLRTDGKSIGMLALLLIFLVVWQIRSTPEASTDASRRLLTEGGMMDPTFVPSPPLLGGPQEAAANAPTADEAAAASPAAATMQPEPPKERLPTIFLSVAAYRDLECSATMRSIMENATHPERVHATVCQQIKTREEACLQKDTPHPEQVKTLTVPFFQAEGPTLARHMVASLYKNEDIFMQIDSHSLLVRGWDDQVVAMLNRCPSKKCIISHYPPVMHLHKSGVPIICKSHWDQQSGIISFSASNFDTHVGDFLPTPFAGAGFILGPGEMVLDVPFDPHLNFVFVGEEILHSARLWTHGYDLYGPDMNLLFHHYNRQGQPNIFRDRPEDWYHLQIKSNARAKWILQLGNSTKPADSDESELSYQYYGMGEARTLQQYWDFAGINPLVQGPTNSEAKFCRPAAPKL